MINARNGLFLCSVFNFFFIMAPTVDVPKGDDWGKWDKKTQTFHGGQEWKSIDNYVEDFSVTTNALGTPESGAKAAREVCPFQDFMHPGGMPTPVACCCLLRQGGLAGMVQGLIVRSLLGLCL